LNWQRLFLDSLTANGRNIGRGCLAAISRTATLKTTAIEMARLPFRFIIGQWNLIPAADRGMLTNDPAQWVIDNSRPDERLFHGSGWLEGDSIMTRPAGLKPRYGRAGVVGQLGNRPRRAIMGVGHCECLPEGG
jgi:hypothetical protein